MTDTPLSNRWLRRVSILVRSVAGLALIGLSFTIFAFLVGTKPQPPRRPVVATPLLVVTMPATPVPVDSVWHGYGTARALSAVDIPGQITARVAERPPEVEPGLRVRAGDLLVRLDDTDVVAAADAAREAVAGLDAQIDGLDAEARRWSDQLELAQEDAARERRELERTREALAQGAATELEVDRRQASVSRLEREIATIRQALDVVPSRRAALRAARQGEAARLVIAEENVARARITSPIDGILQEVAVRPGELATAGMRIARVVDLSRVEVPLLLPLSSAREVREGVEAWLGRDSGEGRDWLGRIDRIAPEGDPASRTIQYFVVVEQDAASHDLLLPGQFVMARIAVPSPAERIVVPRRAVEDGRVFIAMEAAGGVIARARPVNVLYHVEHAYPALSPDESQWAVIGAGLEPGDRIVISNLADLRDGARIDPGSARAPERGP